MDSSWDNGVGAAATSGIFSLGGGYLGAMYAEDASYAAFAQQRQLNYEQYLYNKELQTIANWFTEGETAKAREFNADQAKIARDYNSDEAQKARAFNSIEAQKARDEVMAFQERMSNSAYQRQKADLLAAGYNPLLALASGASTPSGSSALASAGSASSSSVGSPSGSGAGASVGAGSAFMSNKGAIISEAFNRASSSALAAFTALKDLDMRQAKNEADVEKTKAETVKTLKEGESIDPEVRRHNDRYGSSTLGKFVNDLSRIFHDMWNGAESPLSSAKSGQRASDEFTNDVLPAIKDDVEKRYLNPGNRPHKTVIKYPHDWIP